ncbi:VQ motif-containing protein 25-like [Trifolium pratense]|uniref:VQ motif-containing protein 25-like n=1 Tax=Trifolium pratense TaxID=57577 RepID=UPI001E694F2B|nr:VQ motif-containing protein 25-like [Trifolium pratense]
MENKLRNHNFTCIANSNQSKNSLAMHKQSHTVSKIKPKIRIIHIFAPEIIKTDTENFKELVQNLTGKPSEEKRYYKKKTRKVEVEESKKEGIREQESRSTSSGSGLSSEEFPRMMTMKNEVSNGEFWGLNLTKVKEEVGSGGYLGGFSDLEGFISEINGGFPMFPLDHVTNNIQGFEQHQLL